MGELRVGKDERTTPLNITVFWINLGSEKAHKPFTGSITVSDRIYSTALIQPLAANQLIRSFNLR